MDLPRHTLRADTLARSLIANVQGQADMLTNCLATLIHPPFTLNNMCTF
jgi:hypothetical protein